jgi:hypothetical protein
LCCRTQAEPPNSGNQSTPYLAPIHAEAALIKSMIANACAAIQHIKSAAEQLPKLDPWWAQLAYICRRIAGQVSLATPPTTRAVPW